MKKLLLVSAALLGMTAASQAGVDFHIGFHLPLPLPGAVVIGTPAPPPVVYQQPVYVPPAPVYAPVAPAPYCAPPVVVATPPPYCAPAVVVAPRPFYVPRAVVVYGHHHHHW